MSSCISLLLRAQGTEPKGLAEIGTEAPDNAEWESASQLLESA